MRTRVLILITALLFTTAGLAGATAAFRAEPTAVAVVDVQQVFDTLTENTQIRADMQSRAESFQQQAEQKRSEIEQLRQRLKALSPGTEAYKQTEEQLQKAVLEHQVWTRFEQRKLQVEYGLQMEKLYRRMLDTIGKVSNETGYDLVLYKEQPPQFEGNDPQQMRSQIAIRKVLYASDQVDITDQVVQRMNNQYESGF